MRRFIVFSLGEDMFAINVGYAIEVINARPPRHIPETPGYVDGVINMRGRMFPVINMRHRLGLSGMEGKAAGRFLILRSPIGSVALAVDNVAGIEAVSSEAIVRPPVVFRGIKREYLEGIYNKADTIYIILNIEKLMTSEEQISIQKACSSVVEREG